MPRVLHFKLIRTDVLAVTAFSAVKSDLLGNVKVHYFSPIPSQLRLLEVIADALSRCLSETSRAL